jgi:SIR2-like domain
MTLEELKQELQSHFSDRMVTFVGSGLSIPLGLPSMGDLAASLLTELPGVLSVSSSAKWDVVADLLRAGVDLETALKDSDDDTLNQKIRTVVARSIGSAEKVALAKLFSGTLVAPFSRLLRHLTFATGRAEVITPNYDRLIEFSTEIAGYGVDNTFVGSLLGKFDPKSSRDGLSQFVAGRRPNDPPIRRFKNQIAIYKPHGSLDWYLRNEIPVRCGFDLDAPRLMITPGANKYRLGYNLPFDGHREAANHATDNATRYLMLGYGFNDAQLEQHLRARLKAGYPGLLLTRGLTPNAVNLLNECGAMIGLSQATISGVVGTRYQKGAVIHFYPGIDLWNLETFALEVLDA